MNTPNRQPKPRYVAVLTATAALLALGTTASAVQAADAGPQMAAGAPLLLAQTQGSDRRGERRDDRQGDRGNRQDTRDECRDEEGAGKDKRDCKQEGREENRGDGEKPPEA